MESVWQDLRYGLRVLRKNPGFALVAALILALGIGANTTIFSMLKGVILRPLPGVPHSDQIVDINMYSRGGAPWPVSYPDYKDMRDRNTVFSSLAAETLQTVNVTINRKPERVWGELVTGNMFEMLGVNAERGRLLAPEDDGAPGANPVVVIGYGFWKSRFGGDPEIAGKSMRIGQRTFTIVGVAPRGYQGGIVGVAAELFVPVSMQAQLMNGESSLDKRDTHWLFVQGRLKPGVTLAQAEAAMDVVGAQISKEYPDDEVARRAAAMPISKSPFGSQRYLLPVLTAGLAVVGIVLLVACANVASLMLAKAAGRQREMAIRLAVGASRWRLVRQLLTESLLVSLIGGAAALLLSLWPAAFLSQVRVPTPLPIVIDTSFDSLVFGFTFLVALASGIVFGLAPALQASKVTLVPALKEDTGSWLFGRSRMRSALLVGEIALSLGLLIGAVLVWRSQASAAKIDPGFDARNVQLVSIDLDSSGYAETRGQQFDAQLLERVRALPGVQSAGLAHRLPLAVIASESRSFKPEGYISRPNEDLDIEYNKISPGYFSTLHIPLVAGRDFGPQDSSQSPQVAIVNQTFAQRYWPNQDPIGRKIDLEPDTVTVIGVAGDIKYLQIDEAPLPYVYLPLAQHYAGDVTLHVRSSGDPAALLPAIETQVRALDADLPVYGAESLNEQMRFSMVGFYLAEDFLGGAGLQGLLLAAVGIYGVIAFSVTQRTREIGIRVALGAKPRDIFRLVMGQGLRLALVGVGLGLCLAIALTGFLRSLLYGVSAHDPITFIGVTVFLVGVALVASFLPARRAMKIAPMEALRYE